MRTNHKIIIGDSRKLLSIDDQSVHLVVTSPPYWQIKDYGSEQQIGFGNSYEEYINNLNLVWQEVYRVLKPACRLCINIGDQFARAVHYGRYKVIPIRTEIIKFCEILGFDYMGAVIWQKVTTTNTTGGAVIMGSYPFPRSGILKIDYEFILIFKKDGKAEPVKEKIKKASQLTAEEWNTYFSGHWNFPGEKQIKHLAIFPYELPFRLIKMFSFVGEIVLDPFLGSGTTSKAAMNLQRNSIGYEINEDFLPIIREKLEDNRKAVRIDTEISYDHQSTTDIVPDYDIKKLPYIFKDPQKLSPVMDISENFPHANTNSQEKGEQGYYFVRKIAEADIVYLNNNTKFRLIGIRGIPDKREEAIEYLEGKILKKKVIIKFDQIKYDDKNTLMGYIYLSNKTFINAKLIKEGLARADNFVDHKYKKMFARYEKQTLSAGSG